MERTHESTNIMTRKNSVLARFKPHAKGALGGCIKNFHKAFGGQGDLDLKSIKGLKNADSYK
jgi:hypothetical protein